MAEGTIRDIDIKTFPGQHIDAFSRVRTSDPGYRFDSQLTYQIDSDLWDTSTSGDGSISHDATDRLAVVTCNDTAGTNIAILQSHYHAPYTPGRSQLALITFSFPDTIPTGGIRGVGYFDGSDFATTPKGIYLREDSDGVSLNIASNTNNGSQEVAQASWNIDPMDGTGPSGKTLDLTKTNILVIQLQALYVGSVTIGFDIDGTLWPVHKFNHANVAAEPYIEQASLPVCYFSTTTAEAGPCTVNAICASVISEGGANIADIEGRNFTATAELSGSASGTLIVIRCKEQLNSIDQDALTVPTFARVANEDAGCWVELRYNATVTAGTFEDVDAASVMEVSYAGNTGTDPVVTAGTGRLIDRGYVPASNQSSGAAASDLLGKLIMTYSHLIGAGDTLSLIFNGGTASTDIYATVNWKEIR